MIREAIDRILELAGVQTKTIDGIEYADNRLEVVAPPTAAAVGVHTLSGLVELISEKLEGIGRGAASTDGSDPTAKDIFLLVESPLIVKLLSLRSDKWGRRTHFASAVAEAASNFPFGQFMAPEPFIIGLQASFVSGVGDTDYLLRLVSNLSAEAVATAEDDGISQKVATRKGVVLKESETVKSRVKLAPYRTFREVEQPVSEFIIRLRSGREGEPPTCALFESDGGRWKIDAVATVATWLSRNTTDVAVVS